MKPLLRCLVLLSLAFLASAGSVSAQTKPELVVVSVGVSRFQHRSYEKGVLAAAKDARDVAHTYVAQEGKIYSKVHHRVLLNEEATRDNIEAALAWARDKASEQTHVVIFLASHGGADPLGQYSFYPHDAQPMLPSTTLTSKTIRRYLHDMPGKCFLILDTCHSGGCNRLGGVNFVTLAACTHEQVSVEHGDHDRGNGLFTRAFLEGMSGKADADGDGSITLDEMNRFVGTRLDDLSKGRQRFTMYRPTTWTASMELAHTTTSTKLASR